VSDFSRPEYASYVQLCRELDVNPREAGRRWQIGDWKIDHETGEVGLLTKADPSWYDYYWLPSLADWLEMLAAAGYSALLIYRHLADDDALGTYVGYEAMVATDASFAPGELGPNTEGPTVAPTREEAAARLWSALQGNRGSQDVTPDAPAGRL
jgi:hypothetical protein